MILLDRLVELEALEQTEARTSAKKLYLENQCFADYVDLCYMTTWKSRFAGKRLPEYTCENVPHGYNFTQLEKSYRLFRVSGFQSELNERMANKRLTQVMEGVSDVEQRFLGHVLRGKLPYLTQLDWEQRATWK